MYRSICIRSKPRESIRLPGKRFQKLRRRRISVCICNPVQPSVLYGEDDTDIFADKNEERF